MNLKKCLKTSKGWSFIEYSVIFIAVTLAVAVAFEFAKSSSSNSGRIQGFFSSKVNTYKQAINNLDAPVNPTLTCNDLRQRLNQFKEQKELIASQIDAINEQIGRIDQANQYPQSRCNACYYGCDQAYEASMRVCAENYNTCLGDCDVYGYYSQCSDACENEYTGCKDDCEEARSSCYNGCKNTIECETTEVYKDRKKELQEEIQALNNEIADLDSQISDMDKQISQTCG